MIGKLTKGSSFGPLLSYLFRKARDGLERSELLGGTLAGGSKAELRDELESISSLRPGVAKPVRHLSVSLKPGEHLTRTTWLMVAEQLAIEMGWDSYSVIQHHDHAYDHIHIIATRVRADGTLAREHLRDFRKIEGVLRIAEEQLGLEFVPSPTRSGGVHQREFLNSTRHRGKERALVLRTGEPSLKEKIRQLVDQAKESALSTVGARPFPQFLQALRDSGIHPNLNIRGARITGITFDFLGETMKGSNLGRPYGFASLADTLCYDPSIDLATISPETVLERADQHIRRIANEHDGTTIPQWSARAARTDGPDPDLGAGMAGPAAPGEMEASSRMEDLESGNGPADGGGEAEILGTSGNAPESTVLVGTGEPTSSWLGVSGDSVPPSLAGRRSTIRGLDPDRSGFDRDPAGGAIGISGGADGAPSRTHGGLGGGSPTPASDNYALGRQRPADLAAGEAFRVGSPVPPSGLPPMDPGLTQELRETSLTGLTEWFAFRTRTCLVPRTEKSLIQSEDGSWSISLGPCTPEELPIQIERLAETSLDHYAEQDRGMAYWVADDTIRDAYDLPTNEDRSARSLGFQGWLNQRLDLVRSGWQYLIERSKALAAKLGGDPLADLNAEDQAKNRPPLGERWSRVGQLEREIQENRDGRKAVSPQPQDLKKPKGISR